MSKEAIFMLSIATVRLSLCVSNNHSFSSSLFSLCSSLWLTWEYVM